MSAPTSLDDGTDENRAGNTTAGIGREDADGSETSLGRERAVHLVGLVVLIHLLIAITHGLAHARVPVTLADWLTALVLVMVYVLPLAGFTLLWRGSDRLGAATVTLAMVLALLLGGGLHFVVEGPDHVRSLGAGPWRLPFRASAVGLAVTEAAGVAVGAWYWSRSGTGTGGVPDSARIDPVPDEGFRPLTRLSYRFSRAQMGTVAEPLAVTAHHPWLLTGYSGFEFALDEADQLDDRLTELAELKVASLVGCDYCLDIGAALGSEAGLTEAQLRALQNTEESDAFSETERLVIRYAAAMTGTPASVPDELFEALAAEFDDAELVELTAAIAFENYRARFNHAFGMDPQGFSEGGCPVPPVPSTDKSGRSGDPESVASSSE